MSDPDRPPGERSSPGPTAESLEARLRSPVDWLLVLFSDVRPGEGAAGFALLASCFFLLLTTYLLKPARDGLLASSGIQGLSDMELKAYSSFAQSILLLGIVPLYSRLAARLGRRSLVTAVTLFFVTNLVVFGCLEPGWFVGTIPLLGIVFYLWFGVFNLLALVQFWSFAADFYSHEGGTRLFPAIAFGATAGAVAGAWLAGTIVHSGIATTYALLWLGAVTLLVSLALLRFADSRPPGEPVVKRATGDGWHGRGAFQLVISNRYLLAAAIVVLFANWVKTNSDNLLFSVVQEVVQLEAGARHLVDPAALASFATDQTTAFYGDFFFWVNASALVLKALVASRLLRYGGFGSLLIVLPAFALLAYPLLAILPLLGLFRIAKIAEDATTYSLHNTALQVLWLPTTREMKYKGKAAVDTFFVRMGDGLAAATTFVGVQFLLLPASQFFAFNSILVVAWIFAAIVVVRERHRLFGDEDFGATDRPPGT